MLYPPYYRMKALRSLIIHLVRVKEISTPPINIFNEQDIDIFCSLSQQSHNGGDSASHHQVELSCCQRSSRAWSLPLADSGSPPQAFCHRYLSKMSFTEEAWGATAYLHDTLGNSSGIEKHRHFVFSFFVLFPLVPPCSSVI